MTARSCEISLTRTFDCDLDIALGEIEHRDAATAIAAMRLRGGKGNGRYP